LACLCATACQGPDGDYHKAVRWLAFERAGSTLSMVERERGYAYRIEGTQLKGEGSLRPNPPTNLGGTPVIAAPRNGPFTEQLVLSNARAGDVEAAPARLWILGGCGASIPLAQQATDIAQSPDGKHAMLFSREQAEGSAATSESVFQWLDLEDETQSLVTADSGGGFARSVLVTNEVCIGDDGAECREGRKVRFAVAAFDAHLIVFEREELDEGAACDADGGSPTRWSRAGHGPRPW
jgi:hypothetical protein